MCPFCIGTAVWVAAGAVSTGGISALVLIRFRKTIPDPAEGEFHDHE